MDENLLTRIATTLGTRRAEDIASGALAYLLDRYPQARAAFIEHLSERAGIAVAEDLHFTSQVHKDGFGITDISGLRAGIEEVIVEAKITAGLHGDQINSYLQRLGGDRPLLVLLAPKDQLPHIWTEALRQSDGIVSSNSDEIAAVGAATLARTSWEEVIKYLRQALRHVSGALAELEQVEGLYLHIERQAFLPYSDDNLSTMRGRAVWSMTRVMRAVLTRLVGEQTPGFESIGKLSGSDWGFGRSCQVAGLPAWCGMWLQLWADKAPTPFWLQLKDLDAGVATHLVEVIHSVGSDGGRTPCWHRPAERDVVVPLYVPVGADEKTTATEVAEQVRRIASACMEAGISTTTQNGSAITARAHDT
jgi:hypothetical protein